MSAFEPCGPGCACNDLTMVCWGPVDVERCAKCAAVHKPDVPCASPMGAVRTPFPPAEQVAAWVAFTDSLCFCPDDCNCHYPWRPNYCGCKAHEAV